MRLIDADVLKDGYMNMGYNPNEHPENSYMEGWCKGFNAAVDHCIGHVIYAPTIEPERQKGKWTLHKDGSGTCSVCGFKQYNVWDMDNWQNFCGHCGADMRQNTMTTKRAIEKLTGFRDYLTAGNPIWDADECAEAFNIAIKALETLQGACENCQEFDCTMCKLRIR